MFLLILKSVPSHLSKENHHWSCKIQTYREFSMQIACMPDRSKGNIHISIENKCERRKADAFYQQSVHTVLKRTCIAIYFQLVGSMQIPQN